MESFSMLCVSDAEYEALLNKREPNEAREGLDAETTNIHG